MSDGQVNAVRLRPVDAARAKSLFGRIDAETFRDQPDAAARAESGFEDSRREFDFLSTDSFWIFGGEFDGHLVGYATVVRIPKADSRLGTLYVDELYVLAEHRRRGVAAAIIEAVCDLAAEFRYWRVRLNTDPKNDPACALYRSLGFRDHGDGFFQRDV